MWKSGVTGIERGTVTKTAGPGREGRGWAYGRKSRQERTEKRQDMIFDTHAHYDDEAFDEDRDRLLQSLPSEGIEAAVNIGASIQTIKSTLALAESYPFVYAAVGVHPNRTGELKQEDLAWIKEMTFHPRVVAVGEIGLDYHWDEPDARTQRDWFVRQLELARERKLPVVIHSRDAAEDTLRIVKEEKAGELGGVIHCFSYGVEMAREYLNMGFYLGIGGVLTFHNAKKLKEVVEYMPMDRMVLETDCPYLSPEPFRGKRNSSLNLPYVVEAVSQIKGLTQEEVMAATGKNARELYRIAD